MGVDDGCAGPGLPSCLGAHLLAQQRQQHVPHAALTPAGKGVADLFAGRVVLGQRALSMVSGLAAGGLHIEDGVDHVSGAAAHPGPACTFACRKVLWHDLPLFVGHVTWLHDKSLPQIPSLRTGSYVFNAMPERRTVECSFARLEKIRRLCKELRAAAPYLLVVHSYRIFGSAVQDTKRLWGTLAIFSKAFSSARLSFCV